MAGLSQHNGRWVVSWPDGGKRRQRYFRTEDDALAFMATNGLERGRRGKVSRTPEQVLDWIARNIDIIDETGCWEWRRTLSNEGYGQLNWTPPGGRIISGAHRLSYHLTVEPVPASLVVDHLCRNRACVNPDHLEVVVQRENVMRSPIAQGAINAAKTHCANGHPYSPENTYVYRMKTRSTTVRVCRTCRAEQRRRWLAKRRGVAA